jgi:hypothetical protein
MTKSGDFMKNMFLTFLTYLLFSAVAEAKLTIKATVFDDSSQTQKIVVSHITGIDSGQDDMRFGELRLMSEEPGNYDLKGYDRREDANKFRKEVTDIIASPYEFTVEPVYINTFENELGEIIKKPKVCSYDGAYGVMRNCYIHLKSLFAAQKTQLNLKQISNSGLSMLVGTNLVKLLVSCPLSDIFIAAVGIYDSFPVTSAFVHYSARIQSIVGSRETGHFEFIDDVDASREELRDHLDDRNYLTVVLGPIGGLLSDLFNMAVRMSNSETSTQDWDLFKQSKTDFALSRALAKHFYSEHGACGSAGIVLNQVLYEGLSAQ